MKKLLFIFAVTPLFFGCEDLDLQPLDSASERTVFASSDNLPIALVGVYDGLQSDRDNRLGLFGIWPNLDGITDNARIDPKKPGLEAFGEAGADASTGGALDSYFKNAYVVIARANILLNNIDIPGTLTDGERNYNSRQKPDF